MFLKMNKRTIFYTLVSAVGCALVLTTLPGCLGFSLRVRTVIDQRSACLRQVDYYGPAWEHFLMPSAEPWEVITSDSGATARAQFEHPGDIGQDIIFDASYAIRDEKWQEFIEHTDTSISKASGMRLTNSVDFLKNNYFILRTYTYLEDFNSNLIIEYLKYEYYDKLLAAGADTAELNTRVFEDLVNKYDTYQLTCAVQLPGKIISTNANYIYEGVPIWEFSLNNANDDLQPKSIQIVTREYVWEIILIVGVAAIAILLFLIIRLIQRAYRRSKDPFWRLIS